MKLRLIGGWVAGAAGGFLVLRILGTSVGVSLFVAALAATAGTGASWFMYGGDDHQHP